MGELTIKLDDAQLVQALADMASLREHSIHDEINDALRRAVNEHQRRVGLVRRADAIAAMTKKGVEQSNTVHLIHQMREERSRQLGC